MNSLNLTLRSEATGASSPWRAPGRALRVISGVEGAVHDRLVSSEIMALVTAETMDTGKAPGAHLLRSGSMAYWWTSRRKDGDPFMFGRDGELPAGGKQGGMGDFVVASRG